MLSKLGKSKKHFEKLFGANPQPIISQKTKDIIDNYTYIGNMKKPIYILYVTVIEENGELKNLPDPFRFFAIPQREDIILVDGENYLVKRLIFSGQTKNTPQPVFYGAAQIYVVKINSKEEFAEIMSS